MARLVDAIDLSLPIEQAFDCLAGVAQLADPLIPLLFQRVGAISA